MTKKNNKQNKQILRSIIWSRNCMWNVFLLNTERITTLSPTTNYNNIYVSLDGNLTGNQLHSRCSSHISSWIDSNLFPQLLLLVNVKWFNIAVQGVSWTIHEVQTVDCSYQVAYVKKQKTICIAQENVSFSSVT